MIIDLLEEEKEDNLFLLNYLNPNKREPTNVFYFKIMCLKVILKF